MQNNDDGSTSLSEVQNDLVQEEVIPQENESIIDSTENNISQENISKKTRRNTYREIQELKIQMQDLLSKINPTQSNNYPSDNSENSIYDPITKQYYHPESPVGAMLIYNQKMQKVQNEEAQRQMSQIQQQRELDTISKLKEEGEKNQQFEGYINNLIESPNGMTQNMKMALVNSKNPVSIVDYLGKNPKELERIRSLSPYDQHNEIVLLANQLKSNQKLVSKAPNPLSKSQFNPKYSPSYDDSYEAIRERIKNRRK